MSISLRTKYLSIKKDKLSETAKGVLKSMYDATDGFKDVKATRKIRPKFEAFYDKLVKAKPEAIKGTTKPKETSAAKQFREARERRKSQAGVPKKQSDIERDADRPAIDRKGKRVTDGTHYPYVKGNVYYEYRDNRYDKRPAKYPKLEDGGMMAKGGYTNVDFSNGNYIVKAWQTEDDYNSGNAEEVGKFKNIHDAHLLVDDYLSPNKFEWYAAEIYDGNDGETLYNSEEDGYQEMADGGMMAKGGEVDAKTYLHINKKNDYDQFPLIDDGYYVKLSKHKEVFFGGQILKNGMTKKEAINFAKDLMSRWNIPDENLIIDEKYRVDQYADGGMMAKGGKMVDSDEIEKRILFVNNYYEGEVDDAKKRGNYLGYTRERIIKNYQKDLKAAQKGQEFDNFLFEAGYQVKMNGKTFEDGGMMAKGGETDKKFFRDRTAKLRAPFNKGFEGLAKATGHGELTKVKYADGGMMSEGGLSGEQREFNKEVRKMANKEGFTPSALGKEYPLIMSQAIVEALTDANFHTEARVFISLLEKKPEWANKPEYGTEEYKEWEKSGVYQSKYWDADEKTRDFAIKVSQLSGWDGYAIAQAFEFTIQIDGGYHQYADKLKQAMESRPKMSKGGRITKDWNGRKGKQTWGKNNLYGTYDNNIDLVADIHDYYSDMAKDIDENYANEMKKDVVEVMKTGKITSGDGSTLTFADGGMMANGGYMAKGGELATYRILEKHKYALQPKWEVEKFQTGGREFLTFKQAQDFKNKLQGMSSSFEYKVEKLPTTKIDQSKIYYMANGGETHRSQGGDIFADGGEIEKSNVQMVMSNTKAIEHHAEELKKLVDMNTPIEAWVVAKLERAETDLSDVTHYIDGLKSAKFADGGELEGHDVEIFFNTKDKVADPYTIIIDGSVFSMSGTSGPMSVNMYAGEIDEFSPQAVKGWGKKINFVNADPELIKQIETRFED